MPLTTLLVQESELRMIKLFASDLDGTLLNLRHDVDETIRRSLREVIASGAHFACATGRAMRTNHAFGFEGIACEAVCSNGSIVLGRAGEVLHHELLDLGFIERLLKEFPDVSFDFTAVEHGRVRSLVRGSFEEHEQQMRVPNPVLRTIMKGMRTPIDRTGEQFEYGVSSERVLGSEPCKMNCRVPNEMRRLELENFIASWSHAVVNAPFNPSMFEVTNCGVNKGAAVLWLAEHVGADPSEVAVYGDGGNDLDMLRCFAPYGHAYAPLGASGLAKEAASEVIGPCALHAVAHHMVRTVRAQGPAGA